MSSRLLIRPTLSFKGRSAAKTPFERNLLPPFADWFLTQLESAGYPDLFIPVETKGARLLDAVVAYARDELGVPLRVPVLYRPALAYLDSAKATGKSVVILDDATRTGGTLARHRAAVREWGEPHITSLACVGDGGEDGQREIDLEYDLRCWMRVRSDQYHDVLWQLAQLVVARGLPPEVDHHVFRLGVRSRLSRAWQQIAEILDGHGQLTHDGRLTHHGDIVSMTLHWPTLPGQHAFPADGPVRDEGVRKLRLFADFGQNTIHVVPMAFPALDLEGVEPHAELARETALDLAAQWTGGRLTVAQMLIERARRITPETLYRILGTAAEVDLVTALAETLGRRAYGQVRSFTADREVLGRLYGADVAPRLAGRVDGALAAALDAPGATGPEPLRGLNDEQLDGGGPLDREDDDEPGVDAVTTTTRSIVAHLKRGHIEQAHAGATGRNARYGLSLRELAALAPDADELTLSRTIDRGLALTSIVPYIAVDVDDGVLKLRRKYRASEQTDVDDDGEVEDLGTHNRQTDEEAVALVLRTLQRRSRRWSGQPIANHHVSKIIAVLEHLVLANEQITLSTRKSEFGPDAALGQDRDAETLRTVVSEHFLPAGRGFVPSGVFNETYDKRGLRVQKRGSAGQIETYLRDMIRVLDEAGDVSELLMCWGASANGKLGLDFVQHDLELAITELERPLRVIKRDSAVDPVRLKRSVDQARHLAGVARGKVTALNADWSASVRDAFPDPVMVERDLLDSTAAPTGHQRLMQIANALCRATEHLAELVERTAAFAPANAQGTLMAQEVDEDAVGESLADDVNELLARLRSLRLAGSRRALPGERVHRRRAVASELERALLAVRAHAAGFAFDFLDVPQYLRRRPQTRRRTILFADLSGSTPSGLVRTQQAHVKWQNAGLNIIAQWGQAFGGVEIKDREGDDVVLEFTDPDAALLCAALIQEHTRVLRSIGLPQLCWSFRVALDTDEISDADGGNAISNGINRAAKLAKCGKDDPSSIERVQLTPETLNALCAESRAFLTEVPDRVDLSGDETWPVIPRKAVFTPHRLDIDGLLATHAQRLREI